MSLQMFFSGVVFGKSIEFPLHFSDYVSRCDSNTRVSTSKI